MRRHIFLIFLLAAALVAIALLRPKPLRTTRAPSPPVPTTPIPAPEEIEETYPPLTSPSPPSEAIKPRPKAPVVAQRAPDRECLITVVDVAGEAVPEAIVLTLTHSYGRPSAQTKVEESRSNQAGQVTLRMKPNDSADVLAYKVGVGIGASGLITNQADRTLKLVAGLNLDIACLGPHEVPLEGAGVVLTTEVLYGDRLDAYGNTSLIVVSLPSRKLLTKLDGYCRFGDVFPPAEFKGGWKPTLGIRHRLDAEWNRMTAKRLMDKAPEGPLKLFLE